MMADLIGQTIGGNIVVCVLNLIVIIIRIITLMFCHYLLSSMSHFAFANGALDNILTCSLYV